MSLTSKTVCDLCGADIADGRENNVIANYHPQAGLRRQITAELCGSCGKDMWGDILALFESKGIKG